MNFLIVIVVKRPLTPSQKSRVVVCLLYINMNLYRTQYAAPPEGIKASARHILVKSKDQVSIVLDQLQDGAKFADVAREFSTCPSGKQGGSLGSFSPGTMVPAFDKVIFSAETNLGEVVGPVETEVCALYIAEKSFAASTCIGSFPKRY